MAGNVLMRGMSTGFRGVGPEGGKQGFQAARSGGLSGRQQKEVDVKQSASQLDRREDPDHRSRGQERANPGTAMPGHGSAGESEGIVFISGGETGRTNARELR